MHATDFGRTLIIANPAAQSGAAREVAEHLQRFLDMTARASQFDLVLTERMGHAKELAAITDPEEKAKYVEKLEQEYKDKFSNPYNAARYGYIDDVIEPRNTRFRIIRALQSLATKRLTNPAKKHSNIPL